MTSGPSSPATAAQQAGGWRDRRVLALIGLAVLALLAVAAVLAVWIVFFSDPAPAGADARRRAPGAAALSAARVGERRAPAPLPADCRRRRRAPAARPRRLRPRRWSRR